jgi:hypothetical protein
MSPSNGQPLNPSADDARGATGRYRYQAGQPVDPNEGAHPELLHSACAENPAIAIPNSPDQLVRQQGREAQRYQMFDDTDIPAPKQGNARSFSSSRVHGWAFK